MDTKHRELFLASLHDDLGFSDARMGVEDFLYYCDRVSPFRYAYNHELEIPFVAPNVLCCICDREEPLGHVICLECNEGVEYLDPADVEILKKNTDRYVVERWWFGR